MDSRLSRARAATRAAISTWRRVYLDPNRAARTEQSQRRNAFDLYWAYYTNSAFEDISRWANYRKKYGLYKHIRGIYNPTERLVDFYASQLYAGAVLAPGQKLPDGIPNAVPFSQETDERVIEAAQQYYQWINFGDLNTLWTTFGALTGSVLWEVGDEVDRGKMTGEAIWPGLVSEVELDSAGNLKRYLLDYDVYDPSGDLYNYRKEVTKEAFRTWKNQKPHDFTGNGPEWENWYGFVPATWTRFRNLGSVWGAPAMRSAINTIDELNSLASHIHDAVHRQFKNPMIIWSKSKLRDGLSKGAASGSDENEGDDSSSDSDDLDSKGEREDLLILRGDPGGSTSPLAAEVDLGAADSRIKDLLDEIKNNHPELDLYHALRQMSQVTGPGGRALTGDVGLRVIRAQTSFNTQLVKETQMALAIGGERLSRGDWGEFPTAQQRRFGDFDLTSYKRGELDMTIENTPLIPIDESEGLDRMQKRATIAVTVEDVVSRDEQLRILGKSEQEIKDIKAEKLEDEANALRESDLEDRNDKTGGDE